MDPTPMVVTENLTKQYGELVALDRLSIQVNRGQILGFIGPNGAGKTTTIKILVGLAKPSAGKAMIDGIDCTHDAKRIKRLVGYMPDTFASYDNMRVTEYLDFFGAAFKIPRSTRRKRIDEVLEITGSTYMKDRYVDSLSHGMQQRIGIARTLIHDPPVLILDEPANGLDPNARIEMRTILLRLAELGKTLIVTSHILPELSRICDTVAMVTRGKLRAFGTLETIMKQLTQKRVFEIQLLRAADLEPMIAALTPRLDDDSQLEPSNAEAALRLTTTMTDEQLAGLIKHMATHGPAFAQFREILMDLEDAFMSVTRQAQASDALEQPA